MLLPLLDSGSFGQVTVVARIQRIEITSDRQLPVNLRILGLEVRFIEVVHVFHAIASRRLNHYWRVRPDQHGHATDSSSWSCVDLVVQSDIASHNDGITSIPRGRLDPVDGIEDRICATIACIQIINAFDVGVAGSLEHLHQYGLAGLGFVKDGFCTDFEAADAGKINGIFVDEGS